MLLYAVLISKPPICIVRLKTFTRQKDKWVLIATGVQEMVLILKNSTTLCLKIAPLCIVILAITSDKN